MIAIDCTNCKSKRTGDVPFYVYEAERTRHKKTVHALIFALVLSITINFVTSIVWMSASTPTEVHYEETVDEQG